MLLFRLPLGQFFLDFLLEDVHDVGKLDIPLTLFIPLGLFAPQLLRRIDSFVLRIAVVASAWA
jgi:hypothetical protein